MQLFMNLNVLSAALFLVMVYPASISNAGFNTQLNMYGVSATSVVSYALDDTISNVIDTPTLHGIEGRAQKRDADDRKKKQGKEKKEKAK